MSLLHASVGAVAIGGRLSAEITPPGKVILTISGQEREDFEPRSLSIDDALEGRSTAKFSIVDKRVTPVHLSIGLRVDIRWNNSLLFSGTIDSISESVTDVSGALISNIEAVDWNQLCDRFFVSESWENVTLQELVADVIQRLTPLESEGIHIGFIPVAATITKANFNKVSVANVFRDVAKLTGTAWNIRHDKILEFYDLATFTAPFTIGDSAERRYRDLTKRTNRQQYRNRQWILAGNDLTDPRTETFRGDSPSTLPEKRRRTFSLAYPVGTTPTIIRKEADGVEKAQRVGIKSVDKDGDTAIAQWPHWFYSIDDNEISQNSKEDEVDNPTLTDAEVLIITYQGRYPIVVEEEDSSQITARIAVEGGSGIYEAIEQDESIDGRDPAVLKAQRLLAIYGRIPATLDWEMDVPGLVPGHLLDITLAEHGISSVQYMVDEVRIEFPGDDIARFRIRALDGERQQGWTDFWRNLSEQGRKFTIRENEVVAKSIGNPNNVSDSFYEVLTFTDTLIDSVNDSVTLSAYTEDPYSWAFFGKVTVAGTGEVVPAFVVGRSIFGVPYGS